MGHGSRLREVVVLPLTGWIGRLTTTWARRYLCLSCRRTCTVLPPGLVSRYLYTAWAVVAAWFLAEPSPIGEGLSDADAYRRQGMNMRADWTRASTYYWRSLRRWRTALRSRWPGLAMGLSSVLLTARERAKSLDLREMVAVAVAHGGCGPSG